MKLTDITPQVAIRTRAESRVPLAKQETWQLACRGYTCTLTYQGRRLTVDYWQDARQPYPPTIGDVLAGVFHDASSSQLAFKDFCREYSLRSSSPASNRRYLACKSMRAKLASLFGPDFEKIMLAEAA